MLFKQGEIGNQSMLLRHKHKIKTESLRVLLLVEDCAEACKVFGTYRDSHQVAVVNEITRNYRGRMRY